MDNQITQKLNESKAYGIAYRGPDSYYEQDGKLFHMNTKELFCLATAPIPAPAPVAAAPPITFQPKIKCKFCGAERDDLELMKEHLLAMHRDEVPELQAKPEDKEPTDATDEEVTQGQNVVDMTIPELREYAEKCNIDVSKLTLKADIVAAIQKALASAQATGEEVGS